MSKTFNRGKLIAGAAAAILMIGAAPAMADKGGKRSDARSASVSVSYSTGVVKKDAGLRKVQTRSDYKQTRHSNYRTFNTRYRATIVVTERTVHAKSKRNSRYNAKSRLNRVCTVEARGPEARYVSKRQLRRVAQHSCSKRSQIRIVR